MKIESHLKKPKNSNQTSLSNLMEKLRLRKTKVHFLIKNNFHIMGLDKIQSPSKPAINEKLAQHQYNALLYTNIAKLK